MNLYEVSPTCDVWSIGAILYLMITGGMTGKRRTELFDFREEVWYSVSCGLKTFVMDAMVINGTNRATVDELLNSFFMSEY